MRRREDVQPDTKRRIDSVAPPVSRSCVSWDWRRAVRRESEREEGEVAGVRASASRKRSRRSIDRSSDIAGIVPGGAAEGYSGEEEEGGDGVQ